MLSTFLCRDIQILSVSLQKWIRILVDVDKWSKIWNINCLYRSSIDTHLLHIINPVYTSAKPMLVMM